MDFLVKYQLINPAGLKRKIMLSKYDNLKKND